MALTRLPRRLAGPATVLIAVVMLAAACGNGPGKALADGRTGSSSAAEGAGPPSSGGGVAAQASGGGSPRASAPSRPRREYPAGGPTDPVFPPGKAAYTLIAGNQCGDLLAQTQTWVTQDVPGSEGNDTTPLYMSAAYVCLGRWADASRTLAQINLAQPDFKRHVCARDAVLKWVIGLVAEHAKDPSFSPVFVASSTRSTCPPDNSGDPDTTTTSTSSVATTTTAPETTSTVPAP
jgi:hypothetical protein